MFEKICTIVVICAVRCRAAAANISDASGRMSASGRRASECAVAPPALVLLLCTIYIYLFSFSPFTCFFFFFSLLFVVFFHIADYARLTCLVHRIITHPRIITPEECHERVP